MKTLALFAASLFLVALPAGAAEKTAFPKSDPMITLEFPEGWETTAEGDYLIANPKDDEDFFVELTPLEAAPDDGEAVLKEAKESISESFEDAEYGELRKARYTDLGVVLMDGTAKDEDGEVTLSVALFVDEKAGKVVMMLRVASPQSLEKHKDAWGKIVSSVAAAGKAGEADE
ncbi:hypothetical protein [Haloferula sargassicola]|uniref:DUF1795 domain-containing protein n=1 Tax=Haloferula sargassicola TaxID=490096 RepID=A0ABP9USE3_9BACT